MLILATVALDSNHKTDLPDEFKGLLVRRYKHLFDNLINKIERKINNLKRRKQYMQERQEKINARRSISNIVPPSMPFLGL